MTTINAFIKRHPVPTYFALTFAISWGGVLMVIGGPGGIPANAQESEILLPSVVLALVAGPIVAGILLTGLIYGRAGLREFLSRLLKWRVGARWYAVAILTAPLVVMVTLFGLSLTSADFLPRIFTADDKAGILLAGLAAGLAGGLFEEPGWTGLAVPGLRPRYGVVATGLIVGLMWGAWHFIVALWGSGTSSGAFSMSLFLAQLVFYVGVLPAYRLLMVWVYDHTESLLVAMLMHGTLTAVTTFIFAPSVTDEQRFTYHLVLAAAMWVVVAAVAWANSGRLSRQPLQRWMA